MAATVSTGMDDHISMSISDDSPSCETLNQGLGAAPATTVCISLWNEHSAVVFLHLHEIVEGLCNCSFFCFFFFCMSVCLSVCMCVCFLFFSLPSQLEIGLHDDFCRLM